MSSSDKQIKKMWYSSRLWCSYLRLGGSWFKAHPGEIVCETPPSSKITRAKMDWRCGSSVRVPALQEQSPEFKLQSQQKANKQKTWYIYLISIR
jgi:hypothetical protein